MRLFCTIKNSNYVTRSTHWAGCTVHSQGVLHNASTTKQDQLVVWWFEYSGCRSTYAQSQLFLILQIVQQSVYNTDQCRSVLYYYNYIIICFWVCVTATNIQCCVWWPAYWIWNGKKCCLQHNFKSILLWAKANWTQTCYIFVSCVAASICLSVDVCIAAMLSSLLSCLSEFMPDKDSDLYLLVSSKCFSGKRVECFSLAQGLILVWSNILYKNMWPSQWLQVPFDHPWIGQCQEHRYSMSP